MQHWSGPAILLSARPHAEGAALVEVFARAQGRYTGYVHGRRRQGAALQPGTLIEARWRARVDDQLGTLTLEAVSAALNPMAAERLAIEGVSAACALLQTLMPERDPHPGLFDGLSLVLSHLADNDLWPALYARWELGLLTELGYGLELEECALTGVRENLVYVSPKTGRAASAEAGRPYAENLFALPRFLVGGDLGNGPSWSDVEDALQLTGHFLEKRAFAPHHKSLPAARQRLMDGAARLAKSERAG